MQRILTVFLIFISLGLFSQNQTESLYNYTTDVYGIDDVLVNGGIYTSIHPVANVDPFLGGNIFTQGYLNLQGREYAEVFLKYDIEQQKLVLKGFTDTDKYEVIALNYNYIKSFSIHDKQFVNITHLLQTNSLGGFYELIYSGSFVFVKYYTKEFIGTYSNKYPHGKYSETKVDNFLIIDNTKTSIKRKKDLFKVFPEHKDLIKKYIKENKIKFRKASNESFNNLMQYCDEVSGN